MKASRVALLAAAQLSWAALACPTALGGTLSDAWSNLWRTPDQQGQALLDAGEPAAAAARFQDPRRRAYADLEAGRDPQAAQLLAPFTDPESEYNRGNALARAGHLRAALAAYDAALKQRPADRDVLHNRDLVERALRQRHQSPQSQGGGGPGAASSGRQPQSSAGPRNGSGSRQPGSGSQQSGAGGSQAAGGAPTASNGARPDAGQSGSSVQQQAGQNGNPQASGTPPSADGGSGTSKEAPGQAQRDAAAAAELARAQRQQHVTGNTGRAQGAGSTGTLESPKKGASNGPDTDSLLAGGARTPRRKPESERQLALDQWLRQIPDSPAGLLQRKFLIEHMMRQQDDGNPQEPGQ